MATSMAVSLPGGLWAGGRRHQEAVLGLLTGAEEDFLRQEGARLFPAQRTTALLCHCLKGLGAIERITPAVVRSLTIGDREALLLHLLRLTLGERLQALVWCPRPGCQEKLDLELRVGDLLLPPYPRWEEWHEDTISAGGTSYRVRFRLPTGGDQELAAGLAQHRPQEAAQVVLQRCLVSITPAGNHEEPPPAIPKSVVPRLSALMAALDPQAEILLNLGCPVCQARFTLLFDTGDYFYRALTGSQAELYREVHLLACHYHWSEAEILSLTRQKRRLYLQLIAEGLRSR